MSTSSVPTVQFSPTQRLILPDAPTVLAGVQADFNAAFGGNLNPALNTPQGQLASSEAVIIAEHNALFAHYVNQIDPDTASGAMQDCIGRIYFIDRLPATPTSVAVLCTGLAGVIIPVGAKVSDTSGNLYTCTGEGIIGLNGHVTLTFANTKTGPIPCAPGSVNAIYQAIPGWDTALNPGAGVVGSNVESRADFEYRRKGSVALNAVNSLASIYAAVFDVDGVSDVYVTENNKSTALAIGGVALAPHSVYVAVVGGLASDIAMAIWNKKSVGASYNGNTTVQISDPSGNYSPPPIYSVRFQIPLPLPIKFLVKIANLGGLPFNVTTLIKAAIMSAFSGSDGGPRARIGSTIYASRFYAAVASVAPISIVSLTLGAAGLSPTLNALPVGIGRVPTLAENNILVTTV